jgi:hypothetical protein
MPQKLKKLKLSHYTPRTSLGERRYSSNSFLTSARGWVVSVTYRSRYIAAGNGPPLPILNRVGPGLVTEATGKILSPLSGIEPRSPGRPALSQTLYWLSYPAHNTCHKRSKAVPLHAMEALGGRGGIAPLIHDLSIRKGWVVSTTPRPRFTPGERPPVPIVQEAGWAPEPVWTQRIEEKSLSLPGIELRSPGRPARSQTLYYWRSYPVHNTHHKSILNWNRRQISLYLKCL